MELPYRFFINPFLSVTRNSYKTALTLGVDHEAKLIAAQADPVVANLLLSFSPVLNAFRDVDSNLNALLGNYKSKTQTVESLFNTLRTERLPYWEGQIFFYYPEGSAQATALFPNKRKPFYEGTYEQRIQAIKVLGTQCATTPNLASVSANILAFHTQIESARLAQQSEGEGAVAAQRTLRETARVLLCRELYGNMGVLMHKHRDNPQAVGNYYEMELLRNPGNSEPITLEGDLMPGLIANIDFGDIDVEDASIKLESTGSTMAFFASNSPNGFQMGPTAITVMPGEVVEMKVSVLIAQLGLNETNSFFNVQNIGGTQGSWKATVTE